MSSARSVSSILIAMITILSGFAIIHFGIDGTDNVAGEEIGTRAIPWNQVVDGTEITIAPGKLVNGSFYYPIPIGATVLSANMSYSNIPYTEGGSDYSMDAWLNVGGSPKEYIFGELNQERYGTWGKQTMDRVANEWFDVTLDGANRAGGKFILPKNATMTSATFNITGFQRADEYNDWYYAGTTAGDKMAYKLRDMGNRYLAMGAPGKSSSSGQFYIVTGTMTTITVYTITTGSSILSELGYSISNPISITGETTQYVAVGAPGYDTNTGYIDIMQLATGYRSWQKLNGNLTNDRFGEAVEAGDIDGDGDDEIIVGAPNAESGRGTVFIFHQVLNESSKLYEFELMTVINGSVSDTDFGKTIAVLDMNGDNTDDIAVASNEDIYIYHGGKTLDVQYDNNLDPASTYPLNAIQNLKNLGRLSGSGGESLGVGLPHSSIGAALIYHGGSGYDTNPDVTFTPPTGATVRNYGWDLDVGYDYNSDGIAEVAIGAAGDGSVRGWTGIYSITSPTTTIDSFTSWADDDDYGSTIAFGTDLRGDGYGDLSVGAPMTLDGTNRIGTLRIHERYPEELIPSNKPVVYINGEEVWRYNEDHIPAGTSITTGDLSSAINNILSTASVDYNTPYDGYVYVDIEIDMATFSNRDDSNHYNLTDFELVYDYQSWTGDIASAFNDFLENAPPGAVDLVEGVVKVPVKYGGSTAGGIRIDEIDIELDLVPDIEAPIGILHIDEDMHVTDLLDAYLIFDDDYTSDEELTYTVHRSGQNISKFEAYMVDNRYVAIDLPNGSESANWSGQIQIYLVALDINGGRRQTEDITIIIDPVNDAPAVTALPDEMILQSAKFQYIPHARDAEMDEINYTLKEGSHPENMTVDHLGTVTFEPTGWQIGLIDWVLVLTDGEDTRDYEFTLEVVNLNDAPIFITEAPVGREVLVGETLSLKFVAYDLDPLDIVRYSLPEGPTGSSIGFESGILTWTPLIYLEEPQKFRVRATDLEGVYADLVFHVNVTFIDESPFINSTPVTNLFDFIEWKYSIEVIDPDNDIIFIELVEGPEGMIYDSEITDDLIWTPGGGQLGQFDVSLMISSTKYVLYENFTITVSRATREWDIEFDTEGLDGTKVKGTKEIAGIVRVSPSTAAGVWIEIDDDEPILIPIQGEGWSYVIDTTKYSNGDLVIRVTATDGFENATSDTITFRVANDEGKTSPIVIILIIVMIIIILAIAVLGFLAFQRMQNKKEEEEEKKRKQDELIRSKHDMDEFLQTADHVEGDTTVYDQVVEEKIDQDRLDAIDDVFAPMQPGEGAVDQGLVTDEIPEDILQKAELQDDLDQQEPPEEEDDEHFLDDLISHMPKNTTETQKLDQDLRSVQTEMKTVDDPYDHFGENEEDIEK